MLILRGGACQDFPSAQLDDPLLGFSQNFYLCEQLMIDLCYRVMVDSEKFWLMVDLRSMFIQPSS